METSGIASPYGALIGIWKTLGAEPNMGRLLQSVVQTACLATDAAFGEIVLVDESWTHLEYPFARPEELTLLRSMREKLGRPIICLITQDNLKLKLQEPEIDLRSQKSGFQAVLVLNSTNVPILVEGRELGFLRLFNKPEGFSGEDQAFLNAFMEQVTASIERELFRVRVKRMESRLNGVFDAMADGLLVLDADGRPVLYNPAAREIFSHPEGHGALPVLLSAFVDKSVDQGLQEIVLLKPHARTFSGHFVKTRNESGEKLETVISLREVTADKRQDREFLQLVSLLIRRLGRIGRSLGKFRSTVDRARQRRLQRMAMRLSRNLVFLTELKSGPLRVTRMPCELPELLDPCLEKARKLFDRRGRHLEVTTESAAAEIAFQGDLRALNHAMRTLFAFHQSQLARGATLRFQQTSDPERVVLHFRTGVASWREVPSPEVLDWQKCVGTFLAEPKAPFALDLAFVRHILHAHKGVFSLHVGPEDVVFKLTLPRSAF